MSEPSYNSKMTSSVRAVIGAEVLVIDKDESVRAGVTQLASDARMHATCVADPSDAWESFKNRFFSVAVVDLDSPHPNAGIETVTSIRMISKATAIIVLTPRKSYDAAIEVMRAGALDVVHKTPESVSYLRDQIILAAAESQQRRQRRATMREAGSMHDTFLQLLMTAEREIVDLQDTIAGRSDEKVGGVMRTLVVDRTQGFSDELSSLASAAYEFEYAQTGGEALDRGSNTPFHFALVSHDLPDFPQSMVTRSLKNQNPELVVLSFRGPCEGGSIEIAEAGPAGAVVEDFREASQFVARLPDLSEAFRAKEKQRRYTQEFRERHYDFIRKFVAYKEKLEVAVDEKDTNE